MRVINVKLIDAVSSPARKKQSAEKLTDALASIKGEAMRSVTRSIVEEVKSDDWWTASQTLSTQDVHAMPGRKAA